MTTFPRSNQRPDLRFDPWAMSGVFGAGLLLLADHLHACDADFWLTLGVSVAGFWAAFGARRLAGGSAAGAGFVVVVVVLACAAGLRRPLPHPASWLVAAVLATRLHAAHLQDVFRHRRGIEAWLSAGASRGEAIVRAAGVSKAALVVIALTSARLVLDPAGLRSAATLVGLASLACALLVTGMIAARTAFEGARLANVIPDEARAAFRDSSPTSSPGGPL